jgi:hypothetical protein
VFSSQARFLVILSFAIAMLLMSGVFPLVLSITMATQPSSAEQPVFYSRNLVDSPLYDGLIIERATQPINYDRCRFERPTGVSVVQHGVQDYATCGPLSVTNSNFTSLYQGITGTGNPNFPILICGCAFRNCTYPLYAIGRPAITVVLTQVLEWAGNAITTLDTPVVEGFEVDRGYFQGTPDINFVISLGTVKTGAKLVTSNTCFKNTHPLSAMGVGITCTVINSLGHTYAVVTPDPLMLNMLMVANGDRTCTLDSIPPPENDTCGEGILPLQSPPVLPIAPSDGFPDSRLLPSSNAFTASGRFPHSTPFTISLVLEDSYSYSASPIFSASVIGGGFIHLLLSVRPLFRPSSALQ